MSKKLVAVMLTLSAGLVGARAFAQDTVYLTNGNEIDGTIVQQNEQQVVVQLAYGTVTFERSEISKVVDQSEAPLTALQRGTGSSTTRFPVWSTVLNEVAQQPWGTHFHQVPATVMAVGDLPYVPYLSFHCGVDHVVNVYGDLTNPIAFEFGLSGSLAQDDAAKQALMAFVAKNLTANATDSTLLLALDRTKDSVTHNGLKMEVSPPTDADAFGSWWLTISFPGKIAAATIKLNQLSTIAVPATAVAVPGNLAAWNATEMQQAQANNAAALQAAQAQTAAAQNAAAQAQAAAAASAAAAAAAQNNSDGYSNYGNGAYVYPRAYAYEAGVYNHPVAAAEARANHPDFYHPAYRR